MKFTDHKPSTPHFDRINPQMCINAKLRRLHRLLNSAYQQKINPFGLQGSMLSILFIVGKQPGIDQKTIAEMLVLDPSTMSRDLSRLINKNLVRKHSGSDARYSVLSLTAKGYLLLEEISPIWEALHQRVENLLGQFSVQQIDAMSRAIQTNLTSLQE